MSLITGRRLLTGTMTCIVVAACGSTGGTTPPASVSASAAPSASASASASSSSASNPALTVALAAGDLPSSLALYTQVSDGLLGTTANTDSRVFASGDSTTRIEVDIAADTSAAAATTDYSAYMSAASKQVTTQSATSAPTVGQQANEYVGTNANSHSAASLSFVEGSYIVVVTMVSTAAAVDPTVVEAVATRQDTKITTGA